MIKRNKMAVNGLRILGLSFLVLGWSLSAHADPLLLKPFSNNPLVAILDGQPLMMDDIKNAKIHEMQDQLYHLQARALKEKVLETLAKSHPDLRIDLKPEVSRAEVIRFYETMPGVKELGAFEQMEGEIREYLSRMSMESSIEAKYQMAVDKGLVDVFLEPPNDFRLVAGIGDAALWFNDNNQSRRVFLLEYSDFQCPFCRRVQETLAKLRRIYSKEVEFGYRHFPLPFHKEAKIYAEAVECARDQNRFWEYQTILYNYTTPILPTAEGLVNLAAQAGVRDLRRFEQCWASGKYKQRVNQDIRDGSRLGIQGTPTFVLGIYDYETKTVSGETFSGAVSEEKFTSTIERYLAASRARAKLVAQPLED